MVLRNSKRGPFLGCSAYPKCRSTKFFAKLEGEQKAEVERLMPELKKLGEQAKATVEKLKAQVTGGAHGDGTPSGEIGIEPGDLDLTEDAA
jgi:ssDNA-binding Zn-finger/Zn-ribbon topoisomerase 1